ncbi:MAG: right-handed parallel beta-helix repeat-containing protein, partial [Planctomycetes bacterium]|nr:right-handed parallel beta-helix repeat-containing protein [Planctomycetota bacterium]
MSINKCTGYLLFASIVISNVFIAAARAGDYYIAETGSDNNPGTITKAFRTLSKAAAVAKPGDTFYLRKGRYRQPLKLNSLTASAEKPVTFTAYHDEEVILDGTEALKVKWQKYKGDIYSASLDREVWQLFIDDKLVNVARWPNASFEDGSIWDSHLCMRYTDRLYDYKEKKFLGNTKPGIIYDQTPVFADGTTENEKLKNSQTLAETGIDFTGCVAVLNLGHWLTWARPILEHNAGDNHFTYDANKTKMSKFLHYYIYGLPCLDRQNEWWFDKDSKTIYLYAPNGQNPNKLTVRAKVRDLNVNAEDCSNIRFRGLKFFATTFGLSQCRDMLIEDCDLMYPSTNKFMLGHFGWAKGWSAKPTDNIMTFIYNSGEGPFNNIVRNCRIEYPNSPSISIISPGSTIENCYIHDIEWDVNSSGGSGALPCGTHTTIRRNTIHTTGASEGVRPGPNSTVEYNHVYNTSLLQHDGSSINIGTASQPGTIVNNNWVHKANRQGIRFDSTGTRFGVEAVIHHNVIFDTKSGNKFKGDFHLIFNNTAFDCFFAIPKGFGDTEIHNRNSLGRNNLADLFIEWNLKTRRHGIPAKLDHNLDGEGIVRTVLCDPNNFDFRPLPGSPVIDAGAAVTQSDVMKPRLRLSEHKWISTAPDIGAYEYGDSNYWIPGCKFEKASTPVPPDGSVTV